MKKLGQEPAFPEILLDTYSGKPCGQEHGVSKRFYAACKIASSVISSALSDIDTENYIIQKEAVIRTVYEYVDELLKQEEKQ